MFDNAKAKCQIVDDQKISTEEVDLMFGKARLAKGRKIVGASIYYQVDD